MMSKHTHTINKGQNNMDQNVNRATIIHVHGGITDDLEAILILFCIF